MKQKNQVEDTNFTMTPVTYTNPKSPVSEAFRMLRTNLGFAGIENPFRSLLITSAITADGKSTVASNLAVVAAQAGYRVMLVDCDLRKPTQHKIFQIPNKNGFTSCILNNEEPENMAYELGLRNLKVLTSGPLPPNPAEILNSERTRLLLESLKSKFDYVFVDSPPLLAVTDASILATRLDGVLLVVRAGKTRGDVARQAKEQLLRSNSRLMGVVLNQVKLESKDFYYYSQD